MKYDKEFELTGLLARKAVGEITDIEQVFLDEWLSESPEHRELYGRIMSGETIKRREERSSVLHTGSTIHSIDRKILRHRIRRLSAWAGSAAAVLLIGLVSLFFLHDPTITEITHAGYAPSISFNGSEKISLDQTATGTAWEEYLKTAKAAAGTAAGAEDVTVRIEIPRGGDIYKLRLSDGSTVWLNSETVIEYPDTFSGGERNVKLTGEAFFDVVSNPEKPFKVSTAGDVDVNVLGTSFNVTAYPEEGKVTTALVRGSVEVVTPYGKARLMPGNEAVVKHGFRDIAVSEINASLVSSWTIGVFDFEGVKLSDVCDRLSRWYDVEFIFEGGTGDERFSGRARMNAPLKEFLDNIERVANVSFKEKQGKIIVIPR